MKKEIKEFENHHKVIFLFLVIVATILICRFIVYYVVDPDFKIFNFELHHFDYGLVLLAITSMILLFGKRKLKIHLVMLGISFGLIIDELWFVRKQIGGNNPAIYNPSLLPVLLVSVIVALSAFFILKLTRPITKKNK